MHLLYLFRVKSDAVPGRLNQYLVILIVRYLLWTMFELCGVNHALCLYKLFPLNYPYKLARADIALDTWVHYCINETLLRSLSSQIYTITTCQTASHPPRKTINNIYDSAIQILTQITTIDPLPISERKQFLWTISKDNRLSSRPRQRLSLLV